VSFVVDSLEWDFNGWTAADLASALDKLLDRLDVASERKETVWIGEDLQSRLVFGERDLWSLRSADSPLKIAPEIWQELAIWLGKLPYYADEEEWPPGFDALELTVDAGDPAGHPDLAWAHHNVRNGRPVACLGLRRTGTFNTTSSEGVATIHWVTDEPAHRAFWREAVDVLGDSPETLEVLAAHAFPDTWFQPGALNGLTQFVGGYWPLRAKVRKILEVLDDWGAWIFTAPPPHILPTDAIQPVVGLPTNRLIEKRFQARNLVAAPENPNVYLSRNCREAREVVLDGVTLYCEWHFKLEPHQNRIHVHGPSRGPKGGSRGRAVVAIATDHLPLP